MSFEARISTQPFGEALSTTDIQSEALALYQNGISIVPLNSLGKTTPGIEQYTKSNRLTPKNAELFMAECRNLGAYTGKVSGNLSIIHCKNYDRYCEVTSIIDKNLTWVSTDNTSYDIWFQCTNGVLANYCYKFGIDFLGHGKLVICPSSIIGTKNFRWLKHDSASLPFFSKAQLVHWFPDLMFRTDLEFSPGDLIIAGPFDQLDLLEQYRYCAEIYQWGKGLNGLNNKAVYYELLDRASKEDPQSFRATCREIEINTGVPKKTVNIILREFCLPRAKILKKIKSNEFSGRYKLLKLCNYDYTKKLNPSVVLTTRLKPNDIWYRKGFGLVGKEIVNLLLEKSFLGELATLDDISLVINVNPRTIQKKVKAMLDEDLLWCDGKNFALNTISLGFPCDIARRKGVEGLLAKSHERIALEREMRCYSSIRSGALLN